MTSCWNTNPDSRPSFSKLIPVLDREVDEGSVRGTNPYCISTMQI